MRGVRWETVWRAVVEPNAVCLRLFLESEPFKQSRNEDIWFSMAQRCHTCLTFSLIITPYHTPCVQSSYLTLKTVDLNLYCASELPGKLTKICISESWRFWLSRSGWGPRISLLTHSQVMLMKLVPTSTFPSLASFLLPFNWGEIHIIWIEPFWSKQFSAFQYIPNVCNHHFYLSKKIFITTEENLNLDPINCCCHFCLQSECGKHEYDFYLCGFTYSDHYV